MTEIAGEINNKISFGKIEFSGIYRRHVTRSNRTSGKVNVPAKLINTEVYVAVPKKKSKEEKKK